MTKRQLRTRWLAVLAVMTLLFAACGGEGEGDTTTTEGAAPSTTAAPGGSTTSEATGTTAGTVECPHENNTVFMFAPYEENQPAGVNWRAGIEHAVADINNEGGILGCTVEVQFEGTQGDPDIGLQVVSEGVELDPYAILGTVFSSVTIVNMVVAQEAEIPQFVGAEAPDITNREVNGDNDFIFRTSFGGDNAAPKLVEFMLSEGVQKVDIIYKNDEFGAGGAGAHRDAMEAAGIEIGEEIAVQPDQLDQSGEVAQLIASDSDSVFVYMTEIETGAFLDERTAQGLDKPLYGGDVLTSPASLELAQPGAGDGAKSHSNLAAGADVFADWRAAHEAFHPGIEGVDHNNIKGYMAVHYVKEMTERIGSFDRVALANELHCATITVADEPGVLLDVTFDGNGDLDRESFILEVVDGVGVVSASAPPLDNLSERGC